MEQLRAHSPSPVFDPSRRVCRPKCIDRLKFHYPGIPSRSFPPPPPQHQTEYRHRRCTNVRNICGRGKWHLHRHSGLTVAPATIWRHLNTAGLVTAQPKKRPKTSYIRFAADLPNETWQSDFTHWRHADNTEVEIMTFLDDCTRYALDVTAHRAITGHIVVNRFLESAETMGLPASVLTDNGMVYTARFAGGRDGLNRFEDMSRIQRSSYGVRKVLTPMIATPGSNPGPVPNRCDRGRLEPRKLHTKAMAGLLGSAEPNP